MRDSGIADTTENRIGFLNAVSDNLREAPKPSLKRGALFMIELELQKLYKTQQLYPAISNVPQERE
jgi:hypothetical protein